VQFRVASELMLGWRLGGRVKAMRISVCLTPLRLSGQCRRSLQYNNCVRKAARSELCRLRKLKTNSPAANFNNRLIGRSARIWDETTERCLPVFTKKGTVYIQLELTR
jgi:hypothetical protein